jgi:hypothetical protein
MAITAYEGILRVTVGVVFEPVDSFLGNRSDESKVATWSRILWYASSASRDWFAVGTKNRMVTSSDVALRTPSLLAGFYVGRTVRGMGFESDKAASKT